MCFVSILDAFLGVLIVNSVNLRGFWGFQHLSRGGVFFFSSFLVFPMNFICLFKNSYFSYSVSSFRFRSWLMKWDVFEFCVAGSVDGLCLIIDVEGLLE